KILDREIGIAEQLVERAGELLAAELQLQLCGEQRRLGVVEIHLRAGAALGERALAVDVALLEVDPLLAELDQLIERRVVALEAPPPPSPPTDLCSAAPA